jgi:hypothetical protein
MKIKTIIWVAIAMLVISSCRKDTEAENISDSSKKVLTLYDLEEFERNSINRAISLNESFKTKSMSKSGGSYSLDSAIYYIDIALNYEYGNISTYRFVQDRFTYYLPEGELPAIVDDYTMTQWHSQINAFVLSSYNSINDNRKSIYAIYLDLIEEENSPNKILVTLVVGRNSYTESDVYPLTTVPIEIWQNKTGNYRFNYNGGLCSQLFNDNGTPYDAQDNPGAKARGPVWDMHGMKYGWEDGGAKRLEEGINPSVTYLRYINSGNWLPTAPAGMKLIKIAHKDAPTDRMVPWNYPIPTTDPITFNNHNPTLIYSINNWSNNLSRQLPCINYNMLTHYATKGVPIVMSKISQTTFSQSFQYDEMWVQPEFKHQDILSFPNIEEWRLNEGQPLNWNSNNYYEYFRHEYILREFKYAAITDPSSM